MEKVRLHQDNHPEVVDELTDRSDGFAEGSHQPSGGHVAENGEKSTETAHLPLKRGGR